MTDPKSVAGEGEGEITKEQEKVEGGEWICLYCITMYTFVKIIQITQFKCLQVTTAKL